jgi:hypothetical protein
MSNFVGKKCVVTTAHRGVFFGEVLAYNEATKVIDIKDCRVAVYWPAEVRGFVGLAFTGPLEGARISPPAPLSQFTDVTGILSCTDASIKEWEADKWSA